MKTSPFHVSPFKATLLTGACLAFATVTSFARGSSDKSFMENAYQDGLAEIKLGEMAESKSSDPDVKAFAQHMVDDHTAANAKLKGIADSKSVTLPTDPTLVAKGEAKLIDLKSGSDFDKAYAEKMVSAHKEAVKAFKTEASDGSDGDVTAFASKTLPTLKHHLSMAEDLQAKLGK